MYAMLKARLGPSGAWFWLGFAVLVIALDQATKILATNTLEYGQPIEVLPVLNWTLLYNTGAAFSFLSEAGGWQRWFFASVSLVISIILVVWIFRLGTGEYLQKLALALILGGALGNLWDRLAFGHVVDFIQVHYSDSYFPAFNIADSAITVGAALILIYSFFFESKGKND